MCVAGERPVPVSGARGQSTRPDPLAEERERVSAQHDHLDDDL